MKPHPRTLLASGLLAAVLMLPGGCAIQERYLAPGLLEPKDVPREKWSDALLVMEAMGISGQHDLPRELAGGGPSVLTSVGAGALTGGSGAPVRRFQTAAWIPADLAGSPEEASALALKLFDEARHRVFPLTRAPQATATGRYPSGSGREYATLADVGKERPVPFSAPATAAPAIVGGGRAYGPIFIKDRYAIDAVRSDIAILEGMKRMSQALPSGFYIYHPDQDFRRQVPAQILNGGRVMYFVGK